MDETASGLRFTGDEGLDALLDRLYTVAPEEFVTVRDEIAKALRGRKRRDEAKDVAGRRRPTLAAWAVNQAVRSEPDRYGELLEAGAMLHRELRRAMSGVERGNVGAAAQHRRTQTAGMAQLALARLARAGHDADAHREAVTATFDAASADEHAGEEVARGELSKPLERPSEFGVLTPLEIVEDAPAAPAPEPRDDDAVDEEQQRRRAAAEAVEQARREAENARAAAEQAERQAASASEELGAAERRHEAALAALERAQRQVEQATQHVEAARAEVARTRTAAEEAAAVAARRAAVLQERERANTPD